MKSSDTTRTKNTEQGKHKKLNEKIEKIDDDDQLLFKFIKKKMLLKIVVTMVFPVMNRFQRKYHL